MKNIHNVFVFLLNKWYNNNHKKYKEVIVLYSALDVARYIVNYANEHSMIVSNLKLQKILYFIQMQFLINTNHPCFDNKIEAWPFGPVVPDVYREFKRYGAMHIPKIEYIYDDSRGMWNLKKEPYKTNINSSDLEIINSVIEKCNPYSPSQLVEITHNQSPWMDAYRNAFNNIITIESIQKYIIEKSDKVRTT